MRWCTESVPNLFPEMCSCSAFNKFCKQERLTVNVSWVSNRVSCATWWVEKWVNMWGSTCVGVVEGGRQRMSEWVREGREGGMWFEGREWVSEMVSERVSEWVGGLVREGGSHWVSERKSKGQEEKEEKGGGWRVEEKDEEDEKGGWGIDEKGE